MPWLLVNENSLPHGALRNKLGPFKFPIVEKGRIKEMPMEWTRRSYYQGETLHTVQQVTAVDHLPWGQDLPDVLIRGFPMTTMTDVYVLYTVWFWGNYHAKLRIRTAKWMYGHSYTNPRKDTMPMPVYNMGQKVTYDLINSTGRDTVPPNLSKVA